MRPAALATLEGADEVVRLIVSPEGVPLRFVVARAGDRAAAFVADACLLGLGLVVLPLAILPVGLASPSWAAAVWFVATFAWRQGYFLWFEARWHGATPGKRWLGLRVIDCDGGALTTDALFARNLTREVEVVLPLVALAAPQAIFGHVPGVVMLLGLAWLGVFACLPLLNQDRLRVGDLLAGTMVVRAPRAFLLPDVARVARPTADEDAPLTFTPAQLDIYGIYELQVLEEVLRERAGDAVGLEEVADRIRRKIGWDARANPDVSDLAFLRAFYAAQRARLEGRLLLGERRERKRR